MEKTISVKQKLNDILNDISWARLSKRYFGRSSSWMYNKLNEIDGNGGVGGFTEDEKQQLKESLINFADRIQACADKL